MIDFGNMINQLWKLSLLLGKLIDKQPDNTIRGLVAGKVSFKAGNNSPVNQLSFRDKGWIKVFLPGDFLFGSAQKSDKWSR